MKKSRYITNLGNNKNVPYTLTARLLKTSSFTSHNFVIKSASYKPQACRITTFFFLFSLGTFSCITKISPEMSLVQKGINDLERGHYHQAIFVFNQVLEKSPKHEKALYYRGLAYCVLKKYEKGLADFTQALEINEKAVAVLINRGIIYALLGKEQQALNDFTEALKYDPDNEKIYSNRGGLYARKKDYSKALADFNRALEKDPDNKKLLAYKGDMLLALGRYIEATKEYHLALKQDPRDGDLYRRRGNARHLIGKTDAAIKDLNKSIALKPTNALSYAILGIIWFDKKDYGRAIANFVLGQGFGPDKIAAELPVTYLYMGEAYRQKNFRENALDSYETFLWLNPDPKLRSVAEKALEELKKTEN
jgi:tetratricopeptide (TPR) repeat protein